MNPDAFDVLLAQAARELTRAGGPVKWCRICGRRHGSRQRCHLIKVDRVAKSSQTVKVWTAP